MKFFLIASSLALISMAMGITAYAAEEDKAQEAQAADILAETPAENPGRFAPDFCDFEITFPEKPLKAMKCLLDNKCFDVHSYTMVYDLQTSVDMTVTCNPSTPAAFQQYSEPVMKAALAGMVENRNLESHETRFNQTKDSKNASLTGTGRTGAQDKIYTGQLWIGPNSVFTIQAELIGAAHPDADKAFGEILSSVKQKTGKQLPKPKMPEEKTNR